MIKNKHFNLFMGIIFFKHCYQPGTKLAEDKNGNLLADTQT